MKNMDQRVTVANRDTQGVEPDSDCFSIAAFCHQPEGAHRFISVRHVVQGATLIAVTVAEYVPAANHLVAGPAQGVAGRSPQERLHPLIPRDDLTINSYSKCGVTGAGDKLLDQAERLIDIILRIAHSSKYR